jgi:hypothetical protein
MTYVILRKNFIEVFDGASSWPIDSLAYIPKPQTVLREGIKTPATIETELITLPEGLKIPIYRRIRVPGSVLTNIR